MNSLLLDKNNNIVAGSDFLIATGNVALSQDIKTGLQMHRGEYPFNEGLGIDYLGFFASQDRQELLTEIAARVQSDRRVLEFDIDRSRSGNGLNINIRTISNEETTINIGE